jgi:ribosomal peptide maturation radical SAM protein 1
MKLCLIALPWSMYRHPSAAMGALAAYILRHAPDLSLDCRSDYLDAAADIGFEMYAQISENSYELGEMIYAGLLYPERRDHVKELFVSRLSSERSNKAGDSVLERTIYGKDATWEHAFDVVWERLGAQLDRIADELADNYDLVGLTTCFGQLFANIGLCQRLKQRSPRTQIVLGGSTISDRVGASLLGEYACLDYVIQGEGEQPLLALARALGRGGDADAVDAIKGVVSRGNAARLALGAQLWEVADMASLPMPNYDEYARKANAMSLLWFVTIEGSRGCWWDRAKRTGNPRNTCHFCNLNVQWSGYRQKDTERLVTEVLALHERYDNNVFVFVDNIIRAKGVEDFANRLRATRKDYVIFYEMRASISPYELMLMWEAGVKVAVFGIESLSSSYLKRIGKGTSVIANLQAMKTCQELGITNNANLLTRFPGALQEEVDETYRNIVEHAIAYQPLAANPYWLGRGSTVAVLAQEYAIGNLRTAEFYRIGLPQDVYERLELLDLSFDVVGPSADWSSVEQACQQWTRVYEMASRSEYRHLLTYLDGGASMQIVDGRTGGVRMLVLKGIQRHLYMYCMETRSWSEIREAFVATGRATEQEITAWVEDWMARRLVYREVRGSGGWDGCHVLSLAPAFTPQMAARRIREAHDAELRTSERSADAAASPPPESRAPVRLPRWVG